MDVAVSELRAHLSDWLARVRAGEEVVITERGHPVARIVDVSARTAIEELTAAGVLARPATSSRRTATGHRRQHARRPLADIVSEHRG
jgi:prevent-host-death family protein